MEIVIHTQGPEPVYEQIVRQVHAGVESAQLEPGAPLPTVRQLATDLLLNRNTVARAYRTLEEQGVIQTAGRKGTFVSRHAVSEVAQLRNGHAQRAVRHMIDGLVSDGLSLDEISGIVKRELSLAEEQGQQA